MLFHHKAGKTLRIASVDFLSRPMRAYQLGALASKNLSRLASRDLKDLSELLITHSQPNFQSKAVGGIQILEPDPFPNEFHNGGGQIGLANQENTRIFLRFRQV